MCILGAEDKTPIAAMVTDRPEYCGHMAPERAMEATEALALCEALLSDLALSDVNLCDGSNGVVLARALVAQRRPPMIFASSQLVQVRQARAFALGCICKPSEAEAVLCSIEVAAEVLRGGQQALVHDVEAVRLGMGHAHPLPEVVHQKANRADEADALRHGALPCRLDHLFHSSISGNFRS
jgi:CheY-like chemotaxis protein